ncbi:MAG: hypothetical protein KBD31_01250 [Proteobacteria bacterium]|nr:hypothetical protein [Pseudomonadota bacterium]
MKLFISLCVLSTFCICSTNQLKTEDKKVYPFNKKVHLNIKGKNGFTLPNPAEKDTKKLHLNKNPLNANAQKYLKEREDLKKQSEKTLIDNSKKAKEKQLQEQNNFVYMSPKEKMFSPQNNFQYRS